MLPFIDVNCACRQVRWSDSLLRSGLGSLGPWTSAKLDLDSLSPKTSERLGRDNLSLNPSNLTLGRESST